MGSLSKLKVVRSVHFCPSTGKFHERKYADLTSTDAYPSISVYPTQVRVVPLTPFLRDIVVVEISCHVLC